MKNTLTGLLFSMVFFLPGVAYCGPFSNLFNSPNDVAVKVAELHEDQNIEIWGLDFSPDGKYLAATSPTTLEVQIWDWQNKRIVRTLEKAQGSGFETDIRYSPDGHLLVACHKRAAGDIVARIWNTETWVVIHDIVDPIPGTGCNAIGFTPDGKSLVRIVSRLPEIAGDTFVIYDTTTWQPVWGLRTVPFYPKALSISPDGKFAAIGGGIINPHSWPFDTPIPTFGNPPLSNQSTIVVVNLAQHAIIRTMQNTVGFDGGHLAWSPDGVYITAIGRRGWDGTANEGHGAYTTGMDTVMVFDADTGKQIAGEELGDMKYAEAPGDIGQGFLRYTQDRKYLIEAVNNGLGSGSGVRIWDGKHRELLQEIPAKMNSLAVTRDGHYFAIGIQGRTQVWQLK